MLEPQFQQELQMVPPAFRKEVTFRVRSVRDRQVGDARAASLAVFGAVLAVLLIGCANIASLLVARAVARERELAVRAALGASRWRLVRQTLTESLVLSAMGAAPGCLLAWGLLRVFVAMAPATLPRLAEATVDRRMLLFCLGAAFGCGLLFGIGAGVRGFPSGVMGAWRTTPRSRGGLRSALVTLEIAFSMVLLTGAGLLLRSLWELESVPLGMETDHVVAARFVLGPQHYGQPEQQIAFFNELERRLTAAPGVDRAAISDSIPPIGGMRGRPLWSMEVEGQARRPEGTGGMVAWRFVTPEYFRVLGVPILRGRLFTEQDRDPAEFVAVISQSLARRLFPNQDPIGKRLRIGGPEGQQQQPPWTTVIGVSRDVTNLGSTRESWPEYYVLRKHTIDVNFLNQEPPTGWRAAVVIAHTPVNPGLAARSIRAVLSSLDPVLPVEVETMGERLREIDARPRAYAILLAAFAAIGVLLAAVGLFGVMSFLVAQRTREIGVHMALGATPARIVRMIMARAASWTACGILLGTGGSWTAARLLRSLLFRVEPGDPGALGAAAAVLCAAALLAAGMPARRATRLDPAKTLRQE
jgi:putative ABC transport system permease protein